MAGLTLQELGGHYSIARLDLRDPVPEWADGAGFVTISRTPQELSIVCLSERIPTGVKTDGRWSCFQLVGLIDLALHGIAVQIIAPISDARIGFLFVTTFETDYLLVKEAQRARARAALQAAGLTLTG